ncbi:MAG: hypothetical protein ABI237_14285 [Ginsengibacter sp.]
MRKIFLLLLSLFILSSPSEAQFSKLIKKAKEKVVHAVTGKDNAKDSDTSDKSQKSAGSQTQENTDDTSISSDDPQHESENKTQAPKPVVFPITGDTVNAMHAVFAPVIDGDIKKITDSPQGKYAISIARQKGLQGTDMEVFRQLLDPKNQALSEEISDEVKKKFPNEKNKKENVSGNFNPANGGFSTPSLYFEVMIGAFDVWMTNRYIKWATKPSDHFTMAAAFGVNVIAITDLQTQMAYSIASVLGVNYTTVKSLDTVSQPYGPLAVMPFFKDQYQGIEGIKIEPGDPEKYGEFNCTTIKVTIPVRPYMDKELHEINKSLLSLHDILSGGDDMGANDGKGNWDPSYKIIYKGYFSHDIEKYLPEKMKEMVQNLKWKQGMGVGAAITDEKGNSADFRLIDITTDNKIDKGQFQVPADYPVMTQDELNTAIKKQFSLKNLIRKGLKNSRSDQ